MLNETGSYVARWNFTWVFPTTVNTTGNVAVCSGMGESQTSLLERTFSVVMDSSSQTPGQPILRSATASSSAHFTSKPTGKVYKSAASTSSRLAGLSWSVSMIVAALVVSGLLLHVA